MVNELNHSKKATDLRTTRGQWSGDFSFLEKLTEKLFSRVKIPEQDGAEVGLDEPKHKEKRHGQSGEAPIDDLFPPRAGRGFRFNHHDQKEERKSTLEQDVGRTVF